MVADGNREQPPGRRARTGPAHAVTVGKQRINSVEQPDSMQDRIDRWSQQLADPVARRLDGFHQSHGMTACREQARERRAGRSTADDDDVERYHDRRTR